MFDFNAPKLKQAENIGRMSAIYSNSKELLTPTINSIAFEKAMKESDTKFYFEEIVKGFISKSLKEIESEKDEIKKGEHTITIAQNFNYLEKINVVFDGIMKSIYVDVIDIATNKYKDNAINKSFDRVGLVTRGKKEIVKIAEKEIEE